MGCQASKSSSTAAVNFDELDDSIHLLTKQAVKEARVTGSPIRSYRKALPHPLLQQQYQYNDCSVRTQESSHHSSTTDSSRQLEREE